MRSPMIFAGVDGGTGDTEAVLVDADGDIRGRGQSGPSNDPEMVGRMHPSVGDHVVGALRNALDDAHAVADQIQAISLNLSGDPRQLTPGRAREWLAPLGLAQDTAVAIDQDGLSAWAAGGFPDPAIWVLLGTNCGSEGIRDGERVAHPLARLDLDAHLGRAVGAAKIGSWGLGLALKTRLGGTASALFDGFLAALGARDAGELARWAEEHVTADQRAELFRVVVDTAAAGDPAARKLLHDSAMDIAAATIALATWMDVGRTGAPLTVLLAGSAWRAGGILVETFRDAVQRELPAARVQRNEVPQAQGAALLAMAHAGLDRGPVIFTQLANRVQ
jgi:N-acetylglucosamine kinase-like BadF-type ATPase